MVTGTKQEIAAANRRRYEELRAAGQEATPKALPPATALDGAPIAPQAVISREEVPLGWYDTVRLRRGEALRIVDNLGRSSVSLIGWCEHDTSERINCADTAKVQWSAALSKGRVILSDMGRVFLSLIEDTSGAHDLLVGGSTPASSLAAFGEISRNTHENFLAAAAKLGLGLRDIPPCVTFFAPVSLDSGRSLRLECRTQAARRFRRPARRNRCRARAVELPPPARSCTPGRRRPGHARAPSRAARHGRRPLPDDVAGNRPRFPVHRSALRLRRWCDDQSAKARSIRRRVRP